MKTFADGCAEAMKEKVAPVRRGANAKGWA